MNNSLWKQSRRRIKTIFGVVKKLVVYPPTRCSWRAPIRRLLSVQDAVDVNSHRTWSSLFVAFLQQRLLHISSPWPLHLQIMFSAFTAVSLFRRRRRVNEIRRGVRSATSMEEYQFFCTFGPLVSCFLHNMLQTFSLIKLLHRFTPNTFNVAIWPLCILHKWSVGFWFFSFWPHSIKCAYYSVISSLNFQLWTLDPAICKWTH